MESAGYISDQEAEAADAAPLGVQRQRLLRAPPRAVRLRLRQERADQTLRPRGRRAGGLKVYTSIDLKLQEAARAGDRANLSLRPIAPPRRSPPSTRPTATSSRWPPPRPTAQTVFNYAAQSHRQPGSIFKVTVLMAALREGIDPDSTYYASKTAGAGWLPRLSDLRGRRPTATPTRQHEPHARDARVRQHGLRAAVADVDAGGGAPGGLRHGHHARSSTPTTPRRSAASRYGVSPLEMANAFATSRDGGCRNTATAITKVVHRGRPRRPARQDQAQADVHRRRGRARRSRR